MQVGLIGNGAYATARRQAAASVPGVTGVATLAPGGEAATDDVLDAFLETVDAVFVTVPTGAHFRMAGAAARRGVPVFLEWPPATSIRECQAIIGLAEEAGVEVGVSRPLRFHAAVAALAEAGPAALIMVHRRVPRDARVAWPRWLADTVDVCCALARSSSVQRVDAEAVRSTTAWPDVVAFGLRFHSGAYAQVSIRRGRAEDAGTLFAAGPGFQTEVALPPPADENDRTSRAYDADIIAAETRAFLLALRDQRPAPVSILDALHTLRLVERLMQNLR